MCHHPHFSNNMLHRPQKHLHDRRRITNSRTARRQRRGPTDRSSLSEHDRVRPVAAPSTGGSKILTWARSGRSGFKISALATSGLSFRLTASGIQKLSPFLSYPKLDRSIGVKNMRIKLLARPAVRGTATWTSRPPARGKAAHRAD
jgi:hypothetical protein